MTQARRWLPLAVATLATLLLAGGFGLAVDHFATPHVQPAPQLKTVPAATLSRLGVTLSAPTQPLYCGVASAVTSHGWPGAGSTGCAISKSAAESAARQGASTIVVESVLATVNSAQVPAPTHDLLAWVVVTQQSVRTSCITGFGGYQVCIGGRTGFTWSQLVFVDARGGRIVGQLRVTPAGGGRVRPGVPRPPTLPTGA